MTETSNPRDVADLLQRQFGIEGAEVELQNRYADATTNADAERALAALSELRKLKHDSQPVEGDACSALGCRATERLRRVDGRVLCEYCAIEYQQR